MGKKNAPKNNMTFGVRMMDRLKKIVEFVKPVSITLVCVILSFGTVAFFIVSVAVDKVSLNSLNSFVGIVLGVVALTASIVSMFLSFYSIEKAEESDKELHILLHDMKSIESNIEKMVTNIEKKQQELNREVMSRNTNTTRKDFTGNSSWLEEEENEKD